MLKPGQNSSLVDQRFAFPVRPLGTKLHYENLTYVVISVLPDSSRDVFNTLRLSRVAKLTQGNKTLFFVDQLKLHFQIYKPREKA